MRQHLRCRLKTFTFAISSSDELLYKAYDKVQTARVASPPPLAVSRQLSRPHQLKSYWPISELYVTVDDVTSDIRRLLDKRCAADTLQTTQLKLVADLIAPFLTGLFNRSLSTATGWLSCTVAECRSLTGEPSLPRSTFSWQVTTYVGKPSAISQLGQLDLSSSLGW